MSREIRIIRPPPLPRAAADLAFPNTAWIRGSEVHEKMKWTCPALCTWPKSSVGITMNGIRLLAFVSSGPGTAISQVSWLARKNTRFITWFFTRFITRFFPRFQIPGSLGFHWSPMHFPRILRSLSSRNPRFLVRASASRNTRF